MSSQQSPKKARRLTCNACSKSFARLEHLRRHEATHEGARQFRCENCSKGFFRKDALQRHMSTHQTDEPTLLQRGIRACLSCAAAKIRCSGGVTACQRCQQRALFPCTYPSAPSSGTARIDLDRSATPNSRTVYHNPIEDVDASISPNHLSLNSHHVLPENVPFDQGGTAQFYDSCWDPSMLSTINWLANDDQMYPLEGMVGLSTTNYLFDLQPFAQLAASVHEYPGSVIAPSALVATVPIPESSHRLRSSSGNSPSSAQTPQSTSTSRNDTHQEGEYYVDGQAARLPRVKRRILTMTSSPMTVNNVAEGFSLNVILPANTSNNIEDDFILSDEVYQNLINAFDQVCADPASKPFATSNDATQSPQDIRERIPSSLFSTNFRGRIASKEIFEKLVQHYNESVHPLLPIMHVVSFQSASWQLILGISRLGAQFFPAENAGNFAASLHEFLRRILYLSGEDTSWLPESALEQAQLRIFHDIGRLYNGERNHKSGGLSISQDLVDFFFAQQNIFTACLSTRSIDQQWREWIKQEMCRRTVYAIWQLDCMCVIHFQQEAKFKLEDVVVLLPCHEAVWAASSGAEWERLSPRYPTVGSLNTALERLYVEKNLVGVTGEFSRILLIHGLFCRLWEVEIYFRHPLSQWRPTAQKQHIDLLARSSPIWLPSVPTYAQWRNSACDCLDILHWSANATIGTASGIEHPTVLHLHFARVVLLTPHRQIVALAKHLANIASDGKSNEHNQIVRRWALQDQCKARLAMIHAGVLFWHVRRYSANGFYEPASLAIATLALWAFSAFSGHTERSDKSDSNGKQTAEAQEFADEDEPLCSIILLDRPTDDELVQQFVREGDKMRANMNGVGDLYSKHGPVRMLVEGRRLLRTLTCWGNSTYWIQILDNLIKVSKQQHVQQSG